MKIKVVDNLVKFDDHAWIIRVPKIKQWQEKRKFDHENERQGL